MKFAEHLYAHHTSEWRKQYIEYEKMKAMLYEAQEGVPNTDDDADKIAVDRYLAKFHEKFFRFCQLELKKINIFFSEKLAESTRKMANLKADLEQHRERERAIRSKKRDRGQKTGKVQTKTHHDLKLAFSEFYLSLILLQSYQTLNFTGFRKILKKHDKLFETKAGAEWRQTQVENALFFTSKDVDEVIEETENIVTTELEGGDRSRAMKRLRVPPLGEAQDPGTTFRVGLFIGIFIVLAGVAIVAAFYVQLPISWRHAIRLYRGPFLVIFFIFLLGLNTYGWGSSGVNHVLIFELDPRNHLTYQQYLEVAGLLAVIWGLNLILFLASPILNIPLLASPLCMAVIMIAYMLNPLPILHYQSRRWLLTILWRLIAAPFYHVNFADFWLADQLNSLALVLLDAEYLVCFYASEVPWTGPDVLNGVRLENIGATTAAMNQSNILSINTIPDNYTLDNGTMLGNNMALMEHQVIDRCHSVQYGIRPFISMLPAWFRFAQCWRRYRDTKHAFPHVVNAFKYSTSFFVIGFSALYDWYKEERPDLGMQFNVFFWLWLVAAIVSSCYTFLWDIKMDWGLFDKNAGDNKFLREETVYRFKAFYYFCMVEDFVLRFSWSLTMSVSETGIWDGEILKTVLGVTEVLRRFFWNFLRLENEHLNNCGDFRAVRDISITPIDHSDQVMLEKMMDEDDGVTNRRAKDTHRRNGPRKRDTKTWLLEEDEDEHTDTWTAFKGGISTWLHNRKNSTVDHRNSREDQDKAKQV